MIIAEIAKAKVNLTLEVRGKRRDGYHELHSIVAFASFGDDLSFIPGPEFGIAVTGPMAAAIDGPNLIQKAAELLRPHLANGAPWGPGQFGLTKRIPVAAGLGGGSADAAAAMRAIMRAYAGASLPGEAMRAIAVRAGADVPVCLAQQAAVMSGIGEKLQPLTAFPTLPGLLVNPGVKLATKDVFAALAAKPLEAGDESENKASVLNARLSLETLAQYLLDSRNDLEAPALRLQPVTGEALAAIRAAKGCWLARLSGSGPTCFGLFETSGHAERAAAAIAAMRPDWWVTPVWLE